MVAVIEKIGQADPNVSIPAEVKRLALKADEAFYKAYGKPAPAGYPVAPAAPDPVAPAAPDPVAPAAPDPVAAPNAIIETAPVTPEVTPPAVSKELKEPPKEPGANWEHSYKSMKGRHDRLKEQLDVVSSQIASLQSENAKLKASPPAPKQATPPKKLVTEDEERDYGVDLLSVVGKKAREEVFPEFEALRSEISSLKSRLEGVNTKTAQSAADIMYNTLDEKMPNWLELNNNTEFIHWLSLPDVYSGAIRHDLLKAAHERHNAPQVLAFFRGFLAEEAATDPARSVTPEVPAVVVNPQPVKIPLETLAAPGRAKSAAVNPPAEKPIITRADIAGFFVDVRQGKYRGNDAEKNRIEAMIFEAEREGRIHN